MMCDIIKKKYCLAVGASSKANNIDAVKELQQALDGLEIQFSFIATLDKFRHSVWLPYLESYFAVPIFLLPISSLQKHQPHIEKPSMKVFQETGYYGIAEALALAAFDGNAKLIVPKTVCCGFTYAIACENF
ncbi:cobalamin biosynthesis protein [Bartonella sp. HY329]|uniref:cobalamin biosynthesis protein n=1 Tax=unclassified Bartonella TaxID=2645622 RepID=UPI0021C6636F|nr:MULTISPECIES: cobalamin biosynthesis protein [unclassified Bartonella]UXM96246.1 cobalamin biosynthesis protein [Bartonella sp. HY329]UXN10570.1 cobalamin biosynthesis protein [Bartonella sp. HY328]